MTRLNWVPVDNLGMALPDTRVAQIHKKELVRQIRGKAEIKWVISETSV